MEKITKRDGVYYYGERKCISVDDAYRRFSNDYNKSVGKNAFARLDRIGQRKERITQYGFVFEHGPDDIGFRGVVPFRILGLVHVCYCRMIGCYDYQDVKEEDFDKWLDWVFSKGSGCLKLVGSSRGTGRNSKLLKARYK